MKKNERYRVRMCSWSFKLLSKNKKILEKKKNNNNTPRKG